MEELQKIEMKWQKIWEKEKIFWAEPSKNSKKFMLAIPYPYINSRPHLGFAYTLLRGDMIARYKRLNGYNVFFSQGWHATGEPIYGAAKRVEKNDPAQLTALKLSGVPEAEIPKFKRPEYYITYFINKWIKDTHDLGCAIDWRRTFHTTSINPNYDAFVTWQYLRLKEKGLIEKGNHPVIYCPECDSAAGAHSRTKGEEATIVEYILIKFKLETGEILPAATLRPETTYGVTNMWLNPDSEYAVCKVGQEEWIISEQAAKKLKDQDKNIIIINKIDGKELIGKNCTNPLLNNKVPILPAHFVSTETATGVVMSVPSHAPYDWQAIKDLKEESNILKRYGVPEDVLDWIKPIHLINTEGFGKDPAIRICKELEIKNQKEEKKLERATNMVYRNEFHKGVLNDKCKKYKGLKVSKCKELLTKDFIKKKVADRMYETSEPVVCRCLTACHIKIIKDQWFLKYSDKLWKEKTLKHLKKMSVLPEEARNWMRKAIENMEDKACARKVGLGTRIPWDESWVIESLSDSTIYMVFYIIQKYIHQGVLRTKDLTLEFFDFVFLGRKGKKIRKKALAERIKKEFDYFYPVDFRNSGKDLLPNHLPFYIYHHVAFFPEKKRPIRISANGFVLSEGEKMSKSKGNFVTTRSAIDSYSADAIRMALMDTAEGLNDPDFRKESAQKFGRKLMGVISLAKNYAKKGNNKTDFVDKWLLSKVQAHIRKTTGHLEKVENRSALQSSFHNFLKDISTYRQRRNIPNKKTIMYALKTFAILNTPLCPHTCEEIWSAIGNKKSIHFAKWPKPNKKLENKEIELFMEYTSNIISDIDEIKRLVKKRPKSITLIITAPWKYSFYRALKKALKKDVLRNVKQLMDRLPKKMKKEHGKEIAQTCQKVLKDLGKLPKELLSPSQEKEAISRSKDYLEKYFEARVRVENESASKHAKRAHAAPMRPAIVLK